MTRNIKPPLILLLFFPILMSLGGIAHSQERDDRKEKALYVKALNMKFVYIEPGSFMMGSPSGEAGRDNDETLHNVTLSRGFYMQTTEITQGQWDAVMGFNPSEFRACGENCPVERVSWDDIREFLRRLNQMERTEKFRLPTEAEWEYACRAGSRRRFSWGDNAACRKMMYQNDDGSGENRCVAYVKEKGLAHDSTAPVKSYAPNAWGLYDMHGNVWEWVQDRLGDYPANHAVDPTGPSSGSYRVLRGGGWYSLAGYCRSATRYWRRSGARYNNYGFRIACF